VIRNPIPWPDGKRCAVAFTFDMDGESLIHVGHAEHIADRPVAASDLRYGPEIGVPRLCEIFARHGMKQTFFIPGWCVRNYPATIEELLEGGHEIAHHGWLHGRLREMTAEEEAEDFQKGVDAIVTATGEKPRGFRAPSYAMSHRTLDHLQDHGMAYDATLMGDDQPYLIGNGRGDVVELPSHMPLDDWTQFVSFSDYGVRQNIKAPSAGYDVHVEEFDAMWEAGGLWVSVWHPFVSGRIARAMQIERLIEHMETKGGVWFARMDEIAAHVNGLVERGAWQPRRHDFPFWTQADT